LTQNIELFRPPLNQASKQTFGIATEETINTKWPHICDLLLENNNLIYVLCHSNEGGLLMNQFIHQLQQAGYNVQIEDV